MPEAVLSAAKDVWAILLGMGGLIVWFVRLEARSKRNSDELNEFKAQHKEQRLEDMESRHRDWKAMNQRLDGIQSDIKELLQRTSK